MASLDTSPVFAPSPDLVPVPFSASLDGTNDPTVLEGKKVIASVKHTATGEFTVTLKHGWVALVAQGFFLQAATASSLELQGKSNAVTKSGGQTLVVRMLGPTDATHTAKILTDPPAASSNAMVMNGVLWLRNTTVPS